MYDPFDIAKSVISGELDLLCPHMELVSCPGYHEVLWEGCGVIRADDKGRLSFKFSSGTRPRDFPGALRSKRANGELYSIDDHVMLIATDAQGREWRSAPILVHLNHPAEFLYGYVERPLMRLSRTLSRKHDKRGTVRMFIPRQTRLPYDRSTTKTQTVDGKNTREGWSIDHHKRSVAETEVVFREVDKEWLVVTAIQDGTIMPTWPGIMCHALEFAVAGDVRPVVIERRYDDIEHLEILPGPFLHFASRLPRPNNGLSPSEAESFWLLVERFFLYFHENHDRLSPVLEELEGIRNGACGSMQTAALTLAVGVETLVGLLLVDEPVVLPEAAQIESLISHMRSWSGDQKLRERALGTLGQLKASRAGDRLYAWAKRTGTPKELVDRWRALRNRKAHGVPLEEEQPVYDLYYSVVELLYRLMASAIGYSGPIQPTSLRGWGEQGL